MPSSFTYQEREKKQPRFSGLRTPSILTQQKRDDRLDPRKPPNDSLHNKDVDIDEADLTLLEPHSLIRQFTKLMSRAEYTNVTVTSIGRTAEYNDIVLLKAADMANIRKSYRAEDTDKYEEDNAEKKIIFIVHGLTIMGFKDVPCLTRVKNFVQLLKSYFNHLNKFDIFIVPMANPDGVAYSHQVPLWNKNLSPQDACPGVALDRNFDVVFNGGRKVKSCSQQFPGERPFSEPESSAIREVLRQYSHKIVAYIHVHAGGFHEHVYRGDAILYPKGYSDEQMDDDKYVDLRGEIDDMMKNASFKVMTMSLNTLYDWYGKVTGTSVDYASTVYGVPFSLEFVMQIYDSRENSIETPDNLRNAAQSEIWHRTIDLVFKYIFRITQSNSSTSFARRENIIRTPLPPHIGF